MAKETIKIKHLGLFSTGKFLAVFNFILSLVLLGIGVLASGVFFLFSLLLGLGSGDFGTLAAAITGGALGLFGTLIMAVVAIIFQTIMGFFAGVIIAFCFNVVVKLSGGLSFDADISK